ncbi:flagellar assembly protein FliH [Paludibacterium paludis]|uniref:Flagellar assembly protein FliH n=1 Tax=Paludibacterium paludis TaxID=1225769 RepID=A0A918U8P9_9NEIS|nr:flagellar assembly protein FliH [Paludibacterium paludis]GGY11016.1 hypothetical protein GCM10011289_12340 [Paludibacterium paludis]
MKDSSNKTIIPAGELEDWQSWQPRELLPSLATLTPGDLARLVVKARGPMVSPASLEERLQSGALPEPEPEVFHVEPMPEPLSSEEPEPEPPAYPTAAELEAIHQDAWQSGYQAGHEAGLVTGKEEGLALGLAEGREAARETFQAAWEPLRQLSGEFAASLSRLEEALAPELLTLALTFAERLVGEHLACRPNAIEAMLREALASLPATLAQGRLRVNPADLEVARNFLETETPETMWQWIEDPAIERGGCLLETPQLRLDLTLASRKAELLAALPGGTDDDAGL